MNYEAKQWRDLAEGLLFDFGMAILGERSLVAKLYHKVGLGEARKILKMAAAKSDPREYIGAVLRGKQDENRAKIGDIIDGHQWTGSQWKRLEA